MTILDLGCGDGSFITSLKKYGIKGDFIGIDLSYGMVRDALMNLNRTSSDLFVGDGFNLALRNDIKFDLIHLDCVLHHLIGKNRNQSKLLAQKLFSILHGRLSNRGFIVVEEMYYSSFIFPEFTSAIIFYGLKLMKLLHIDLSKIRNEFQLGLEVNFFSNKTLEEMFRQHSKKIQQIRRNPAKIPKFYRIFLLKDLGRVSYAVYL